MTLKIITHPVFALHPVPMGHPERPDRIRTVWQAIEAGFSDIDQLEAPLADQEAIALVHDVRYLEYIASSEPGEEEGLNTLDGDTHMGFHSLEAGLRAAGGAVLGVDQVMTGQADRVFLAARPPGHHAEPDRAMGFCLFASAAIAAQHARVNYGLTRVAVLDFDVHHGNGTQAAFWKDGDLSFASSHQMPLFPGTGALDETGVGNIHNAPLRAGSDGAYVTQVWEDYLIPKIRAAKPELILISAGFDAHSRDPLANINCEAEDFGRITTMIRQLAEDVAEGRIVSLLEGGYDLEGLRSSLTAHLTALS
ncbi:MAG: acetoin utilization protein [SAR116 cluster bacterium MED-G04]|jgi:acetoin utilization deacetylase AcuC-like enzyme|nr:MAG: acetoin utilization protein [SAR116 cluster bacterium MED-G04]HCD50621.1 acetoin utilization protein [Alphaproteobacteria bacterium]HCV62797.1 acetoin utilization protein [Alphaproteobacteria bacterium]|tara:strand:- start:632 stop:1555 length:924 start_codon:yes stop_codon:yes gene_type:complete